jgi:hypothetical protein
MNKIILISALLATLPACADRERAEQFCQGILDASDGCVARQLTLYELQDKAEAQQAAEREAAGAAAGAAPEETPQPPSLSEQLVKEVQQSCEARGGSFQKGAGGLGAGCVMGPR